MFFLHDLLPAWLSTRGLSHFRNLFHPVTGRRLVAVATVHLELSLNLLQPFVQLLNIVLQIFDQGKNSFWACFIQSKDLLLCQLLWLFAFPSHVLKYIKELS